MATKASVDALLVAARIELAALLREGWGLGYPVPLTDEQVADVIYYTRWPKV